MAESRLEISAHENGVHDLSLTSLEGSLVAVSGGGDCMVKVWDATTGRNLFEFAGDERHMLGAQCDWRPSFHLSQGRSLMCIVSVAPSACRA